MKKFFENYYYCNYVKTIAFLFSFIPFAAFAQNSSGVNWTPTDWMSLLSDDALVCQLSIPGTHDSATGEGWRGLIGIIGGDLASKTQEAKVSEQYNSGVRAFDIRPSLESDGHLYNSHGVTIVNKKVETLLDEMIAFLDEHPTEFFLFHVFKGGTWNAPKFSELLNKDKYIGRIAAFRDDLRVGEMRGKLLFFSRHDHEGNPWLGGYYRNWTESGSLESGEAYINANGLDNYSRNEGSAQFFVQDISSPSNDDAVKEEVDYMVKLLDYSTRHKVYKKSDIAWVFNLTSGCNGSGSSGYRKNASITNKRMFEYLTAPDYVPGPTGIVLMDFSCREKISYELSTLNVYGTQLINAIIDNNFRCDKSQLTLFPDVNKDGKIDVKDLTVLVNAILNQPTGREGVLDVNDDGAVDYKDVKALADVILHR